MTVLIHNDNSSRKFFSVEGVWLPSATLQIKYNFQFFFIHFNNSRGKYANRASKPITATNIRSTIKNELVEYSKIYYNLSLFMSPILQVRLPRK